MKGVIYARYSPGPNQTEQSIEGQLRECKQYAEENDITIVNTYADRKQTGRNDNRAEFQRMLRDSKKKSFDVVIVWKIDRFGRNREEIAKNKAILRLNGVKVLFAKEHIPEGPEGIILESVLEGLAEYYSANLSQNILRGMRESALKCQFNGSGLAQGYSVDSDHKYVIDPEGAEVVKLIFKMFDEGNTITMIMKHLNDRGIKTLKGKSFTHGGISRILRNRQYIGEYRWRDVVVPDGVPQIIEKDLFERIQKKLDLNKRAPAKGKSNVNYLLTGKIFCGMCKGTMIGESGKGRSGETFYYYKCRTRKTSHICKKKTERKEWLEKEIVRITAEYVLTDSVISYIADRIIEIQEQELADTSMLKYYENRLKETQRSINNLMKAIEEGIITASTRDRLLALEEEKRDLNVEIEREKLVRPAITREQIIYFLESFKGGDVNDEAYCERIIDTFVNKVLIYDDKIVITYNHSDETREITAELIESSTPPGSTPLPPAPPNAQKPNHIFFVGMIFGISVKIADR